MNTKLVNRIRTNILLSVSLIPYDKARGQPIMFHPIPMSE
uniref:Uncharacterized protein n=1 Tax=Anguilla anguilla TaxID=7936 RepID=A0A0E9SWR6_ANGAN